MVSKYDLEYYEEESIKYAWTIPIACGIFTFIYWFIVTPILWNAINMRNDSEAFGIFLISMAIFWVVIVGLFMCIWWLKRRSNNPCKEKEVKDRVSVVKKDSGEVSDNSDSPPFPTQPHMVQPSDTPVSYSFNELHANSEKDVMNVSLNSCPVQLQDTPSLYNARTEQQSFDLDFPDSRGCVSVPNTSKNSLNEESDILTVEKSNSVSSGVCRISSTDTEGVKGDVLKGSNPLQNKAGHDKSITVETAIIEHNALNSDVSDFSREAVSDSRVPRLSSSDSFHGIPEMNSFDAYLHLTTVDTPTTPLTEGASLTSAGLTPRQVFFMDLINQAGDNQTAQCMRRSVGDGAMPRQKATSDNRKSMPIRLYHMNNPQSHILSSEHVLDTPAVTGSLVDSEDPISVTDNEDHSLSSPTQKSTSDDLQSSVKNTESEYIDPEGSTDVKTGRDVTGGEFFMANISGNKSVTSEVYLSIGDGAMAVVEPGTSVQWELVVDDNLSDDCVFEDDVAVKKKEK